MKIRIKGAQEHNLDNVDVEVGDGLTAVTGVSGSGKTSLVFDTLYHEARRRFLEVYALGTASERLAPAKVKEISGLGPAVAVGQNLLNRNPNSTLASAVGITPFLRILYARFGELSCPNCGSENVHLAEEESVNYLLEKAKVQALTIWVLLVQRSQGSHSTLLHFLAQEFGPQLLHVDGQAYYPAERLDPSENHDIALLLNHYGPGLTAATVREDLGRARALGSSIILVRDNNGTQSLALDPVCTTCGSRLPELEPTHFNRPCPHCEGGGCDYCAQTGLFPAAAAVRWHGFRFPELLALSVDQVEELFRAEPKDRLRSEIWRRLGALRQVGLGYVNLDRPSPSLSRGEAQRARLAVTLTSRLEDMLHVFDEPTIGQHPADTKRFLPVLRQLPGPVVYVEHDGAAVAAADQVIDLGPGAGKEGGKIIFKGPPEDLWHAETPSGRFFSGRQKLPIPAARQEAAGFLEIKGAACHNLNNIHVRLPTGRLTVVSGVSGSGKSTLTEDVLAASLQAGKAVGCQTITGELLQPVMVDQSPIGRNPRSNPATYTNLANIIRDLFAAETGLSPSTFSFNRPEGACPVCTGLGAVEVKMRYLTSSWIPCAACDGLRFNDEVLAARVRLNGQKFSIADLYSLSIAEFRPLLAHAQALPASKAKTAGRILQALVDVGLGYISLGQPSPTLSGGEAQRVKLAKFLGQRSLKSKMLILDEPTTGLHPQDVSDLVLILLRLVRAGSTVVVVEHNLDVIRAADWIIDLGPGAGPNGGNVLYSGPAAGLVETVDSPTARALAESKNTAAVPEHKPAISAVRSGEIVIKNARVHNLKGVEVAIPKKTLTVVTGVSGSGKSSLVKDILEVEARRRFLESLSLYERQTIQEKGDGEVDEIIGLGVAISVGERENRRLYDQRATVGTATEIARYLAVLLSWGGESHCITCGEQMVRETNRDFNGWHCPNGHQEVSAEPRLFSAQTYAAACQTCNGVGTLLVPNPDKLIIDAQKPLCKGAMYSPGFFPKGFLCKPFNSGYDMLQALARHYDFDPHSTPWRDMSSAAQRAFLYGDDTLLETTFRTRTQSYRREFRFPGFYGFIRDWDVGGTYTDKRPCPACKGAKLRPKYLAVTLAGHNIHQLSQVTLATLFEIITSWADVEDDTPRAAVIQTARQTILRRLHFLNRVGLGYLHLDRQTSTLSAGEAQRIKLAGLLGSGLTSLTLLLDEPTRGLHPAEVEALKEALFDLRDEDNTVIVIEHDPLIIKAADHLIDMGPGAGAAGGQIVAQGTPEAVSTADTLTGAWLRSPNHSQVERPPRQAAGWMEVRGARAHNLKGDLVRFPLGALTGVCGVSGSGKSTLLIDTIGRYIAPKKQTTSVAYEPIDPGEFEAIMGQPDRTILLSQSKEGITSPLTFFGLEKELRKIFAETGQAAASQLFADDFARNCSVCNGSGMLRFDMGFLPTVHALCETCHGTGFLPEAWQVSWRGVTLPDLVSLTIDEVYKIVQDQPRLEQSLAPALDVGLGYLVLRQPGFTLSGGEVQRLRIARELGRKTMSPSLYILDEPTVGLHITDVHNLIAVLNRLVDQGHTVIVIEHHTSVLAACDWLVEFGPGGGPHGGRIIAFGSPREIAQGKSPTAPFLRELLLDQGKSV